MSPNSNNPALTHVALSIILYSICSGSLVLLNKLTLHFLPFPSFVLAFQFATCLVIIRVLQCFKVVEVDPIKWEFVKPYLFYTAAFSMGAYCNMRSLDVANVETVIVFRAMAPIVVSALDALFLGREWPSARSWTALIVIALGAMGYAAHDGKVQINGIIAAYIWPTLYLFFISFEMAYGKKLVNGLGMKTLSGPVVYTNILSLPPMLVYGFWGGEHHALMDESVTFPMAGIILLALGCIVGTGIGYSGWWCRGMVSATTFTVVGVMNKFLTVLTNLLIWDQHAAPAGIASLLLCLVGGSFYQQAPMRSVGEVAREKAAADAELTESDSDSDTCEREALMSEKSMRMNKDVEAPLEVEGGKLFK